ncbi:amidohydrolase family protein [Chelatococcus sambhunathii]|uniref:Amidohydrolase family protein n=1 Tax=Chelatococcus sambhunathii TaxID=363953 RepID=A0ABU1DIP8_9HYPH|nr:amidohydrolase family protein [Chelatococcus sambhunathii]
MSDPSEGGDYRARLATTASCAISSHASGEDTGRHDRKRRREDLRNRRDRGYEPRGLLPRHDGVLVQVSVHGVDNRLMLETLRAHRERLRGVAVIEPDASEATLRALDEAGVRALRLNVLFGGGIGFEKLERLASIAREMGWHLEFLIDAKDLVELAPRLRKSPARFVIDHMGHFPTSRGLDDPGFRTLLGFVGDGAWVKLSGAYRTSVAGTPYEDVIPFARALLKAAPDRCVWGSDWPHVAHWPGPLNAGDLLDGLADWAPADEDRQRVLVRNPAHLYGF